MQQNSLAYARHWSDECREHRNPVKRRLHEMTVFTIDKDNDITAFASGKKADGNPESERFRTVKELDKVARKWPASRLIEIWNSLPGVSPVRKFTSRQVAIDWLITVNIDEADGSGANSGRVVWMGIMAGMTAPALDLFKGRHFDRDVLKLCS
jgi:hypothetical protein